MTSTSIVFVTGANTGLGFQTVKALYQSSKAYAILLGARNLDKAKAAIQEIEKEYPRTASTVDAVQIDIEDDNSIANAFKTIAEKYEKVDVLINNAGGQFDQQLAQGKMSMREMWNKSWNVNTTGTYILTHTFIPLLLNSSNPRLLFITSGTSTLAEQGNTPLPLDQSPGKGWPKQENVVPAYRSSKTGMNMMMKEWARMLKKDGVKVWCISPGYLATGLGGSQEMNKKMGAQDPGIGANFIRDVIEGARDQDVGKVIRRDNVQPW